MAAAARFLSFTAVLLVPCLETKAAPVTIPGVPAYLWYHGCEPTSVAMVLGYWDLHGYPNLFQASGSAVYLTANVEDEISSPAHNAKYDPTPDISDSILPVPPYTSIADWMGTSVDPLAYGDSHTSTIKNAIIGYATSKGYPFQATTMNFSTTWTALVNEVNLGRPMLFYVDSNGDGIADHVVPVFGYDDRGIDGKWYACYTTGSEDETPVWYGYQQKTSGVLFGVYTSTQVVPPTLAPEPSTLAILLVGGSFSAFGRYRMRAKSH